MSSELAVEITSHCWRYSRCLAYQMSGLILDPPKCEVQLTVYFNDADAETVRTLTTLYPHLPVNVHLVARHLDTPRLFRRAIGRNDSCLQTLAEVCTIQTDVDYVWHGKAIDEVVANAFTDSETGLCFPSSYQKQNDHATGDACLALQDNPQVLGLNPDEFHTSRLTKAIGGVHIIPADVARKHGYLNGTRWMNPHRGDKFACCRDDAHHRGYIVSKGYKITSFDGGGEPWRIRHGVKGRENPDIRN